MKKKVLLPLLMSCLTLASCMEKTVTYDEFNSAAKEVKAIAYNTCKYSYIAVSESNGTEVKTEKSATYKYNATSKTWELSEGELDLITKAAVLISMNLRASSEINVDGYTYELGLGNSFKVSYEDDNGLNYRTYNSYGYLTCSYAESSISKTSTKFTWIE